MLQTVSLQTGVPLQRYKAVRVLALQSVDLLASQKTNINGSNQYGKYD